MNAVLTEVHSLIDTMSERSLNALRPLLDILVENDSDGDVLTDEEKKLIADSDRRYREHPEDFVSLDDFKARLRAEGKL
jgi:hypothetical protein